MKFEKVIAATDFSEDSLLAVETAFNLNLEPGAAVYLLHVLDVPSGVDPIGVNLRERVQELASESVAPGHSATHRARPGRAVFRNQNEAHPLSAPPSELVSVGRCLEGKAG